MTQPSQPYAAEKPASATAYLPHAFQPKRVGLLQQPTYVRASTQPCVAGLTPCIACAVLLVQIMSAYLARRALAG